MQESCASVLCNRRRGYGRSFIVADDSQMLALVVKRDPLWKRLKVAMAQEALANVPRKIPQVHHTPSLQEQPELAATPVRMRFFGANTLRRTAQTDPRTREGIPATEFDCAAASGEATGSRAQHHKSDSSSVVHAIVCTTTRRKGRSDEHVAQAFLMFIISLGFQMGPRAVVRRSKACTLTPRASPKNRSEGSLGQAERGHLFSRVH